MHKITGSCYCGNITIDVGLSQNPDSYNPRACDCTFCVKHGACYISDSKGALTFRTEDPKWLKKFRQSDPGIADLLHCGNCGVLVGVVFQSDGKMYGAVNSRTLDEKISFSDATTVSPKQLSTEEKINRWKSVWFQNVQIHTSAP